MNDVVMWDTGRVLCNSGSHADSDPWPHNKRKLPPIFC